MTSTHSYEDGMGGAVATTEASAKHQNLYAVAGALCFFLHQSDKWHNEATPLNVREPSVALPVGLCRRQKGETREEGGHIIECICTIQTKSTQL